MFPFENGVLRLPSVLIDGNGKINASLSEIAFLTLQRLNEPWLSSLLNPPSKTS